MTNLSNAARRAWMAVLACASRDSLADHAQRALSGHDFETLRTPEVGLTMVRARMDVGGDRFNLGEATITRCAVRLRSAVGSTVGVGYLLGRDVDRVRWMAQFDALLQHPQHQADVLHAVIEPLQADLERLRTEERAHTATSRVQFFTLQAETTR